MEGDLSSYMGTFAPDAGIIPRTLFRLFHVLNMRQDEFSVHMSFVELYNEELRDLLSPDAPTPMNGGPSGLKMYEEKGKGVVLHGLEEIPLTSAEHGLRMLRFGSQKRHIAATRCNESSSRSHCVFTLHVHVKETGARGEEVLRTGKLNLVDLAGSENIGRSGAENKRAREAGMINQSLLTLGRVINALVDGSTHIPYRESRLTRLLQDSLGGRTKTCIIATVSDDRTNLEETLSTLDYALRAKSIKNRPELNQRMTRGALIKEYVSEIDRLRSDLVATREKNGIYVDADNWAKLEAERTAQAKQMDELRRSNEVAQSKLASMHEQLEQNTTLLARRDKEWTAAEAVHAARIHELEASLAKVTQLSSALQEETALHRARKHNEQRLHDIALSLHRAANASTRDIDALHAKLQRRAQSDEEARAALRMYYEQIDAVCAQVAAQAAQRHGASDGALHALATRIQDERTTLRATVTSALEGLAARLASASPAARDASFDEAQTQVADAIQAAFSALQFEHATSVETLQNDLAAHVDTRLAEAVQTASTLAHQVDKRLTALDERTAALQEHSQAVAAREVQRVTQQNKWLVQLLDVEKKKTSEMRTTLLGAVDQFEAEREKRFSAALSTAHTDLASAKQGVSASKSTYDEHLADLRSVHEALAGDVADAVLGPEQTIQAGALIDAHADAYAERLAAGATDLTHALEKTSTSHSLPSATYPRPSPCRGILGEQRAHCPRRLRDRPCAPRGRRVACGARAGDAGQGGTYCGSRSIPRTPLLWAHPCTRPPTRCTSCGAPLRRSCSIPSFLTARRAKRRSASATRCRCPPT